MRVDKIADVKLQAKLVVATMVLFVVLLALNEWLLLRFEFGPGISYVYLPAGARLICILLFAEAGAVGLLLISWLVCFFYFFPNDFMRSFAGGILAALGPYLANLIDRGMFGLRPSLSNLSSRRLLLCILTYSAASPLLHHAWFWLHGDPTSLRSLLAMMMGDLNGTLIVVYLCKFLLSLLPASPQPR